MFKRVTAGLLATAMPLMVFAGCGSTATSTSAGAATGDTASSTATQTEEPVTIKIFGSFWPDERNEVTEYFIQRLEEANNVKLELEVPPQASYAEKLQIMLASGEYPDVVNFSDVNDKLFIQGVNDGLFIPMTEYLKDCANLQAHTYDVTWDAVKTKQTDDIYMIPRTTVVRNDGFAIRQDWLDNVGITLPEDGIVTKDQFTEIMDKFTNGDPDGNGQKDTYGLAPSPSTDGYIAPILRNAFGDLGWQESTGEYKYMNPAYEIGNKNYRALLEYNAMLWSKGYIHPDWPILKSGDDGTKLFAGEVGTIFGFAGHMANRQSETQKIHPEAKITYLTGVSNDDGKLVGSSTSAGIWGGWAVTSSCKNPEKVAQIFDWMLSDEGWDIINYGKPDVTYTESNGVKTVIPDAYKELKFKSWGSIFMRRCDDPSFFLDLSLPQAELDQTKNWIQTSMDTVVFSKDMGFKPEITNDAGFIEIENKRKEVLSKVIMGALPIDDYDKILENWYAKGGQTYVEQMNEYITAHEK